MGNYDDILYLPHPISSRHLPMSMMDRAAQFSPFAALTGYSESIQETARLPEQFLQLAADQQEALNEKLMLLQDVLDTQPAVTITYFEKDAKKLGGCYRIVSGCIQRIDPFHGSLLLTDGLSIEFSQIYEVDSPLFRHEFINTP